MQIYEREISLSMDLELTKNPKIVSMLIYRAGTRDSDGG
jgi:hypothetical protein